MKTEVYGAKLKASENAEKKSEIHAAQMREVYEKLDGQRTETFLMKTEEMRQLLGTKLKENNKLLDEVTRQSTEINEKNQKIVELEKNLETSNSNCKF